MTYPTIMPALTLDFANSQQLDPRVTFSRSSGATYINSAGLVVSAADHEPRFDHDPVTGECLGLLIEESRTNLLADSASANNWTVLAGGTTAASSSICPDGSTDGTRVTAVALNDGAYKTFSVTTTGNHIGSYYARTRTGVAVDVKAAISGITGPTVTLPADGTWVRVVGGLSNLGAGSKYLSVRSANASMDIDVWGLQAEADSFPTSYIPTTSSTVTRSADIASITGTNFSSWYGGLAGTYTVEALNKTTSSQYPIVCDNGTTGTRILFNTSSAYQLQIRISGSTSVQLDAQPGAGQPQGMTKYAGSYSPDGASVAYSGVSNTDSTADIPQCSRLQIGQFSGTTSNLTIARISYYNERLTDAELQTITL